MRRRRTAAAWKELEWYKVNKSSEVITVAFRKETLSRGWEGKIWAEIMQRVNQDGNTQPLLLMALLMASA